MSDADNLVTVEKNDAGYAVVTLNRPQSMNALSSSLCRQFTHTVDALEADPAVRVLILTGAGRGFCAGLDLKELASSGSVSSLVQEYDPVRALERFSGPVIGAINGVAVTGGFELALACDILLASTEARFADTHARVGIMPGWGLSQKLSRLVGMSRAKEISFAGNFVSASRACEIGLVNRVLAPDCLLEESRQLALDILSADAAMLPAYKQLMDQGFGRNYADALRLERERCQEWNASVQPEEIGRRREAVQQRGRAQTAAT